MIGYLYLSFAIFGTSVGQLLLKKYNQQTKKITLGLLLSLSLLVSVPLFTYLSLQYIDFVIVFLADAVAISLIVLLSKLILNENLGLQKIIGIILILLGLIMLKGSIV